MYNYLEGRITEINPAFAVIDCGGIGYMLGISLNTYTRIKDFEKAKLFTHLAFKTEASTPVSLVLYGFADEEERMLFRNLISVSGVGYNTAMLMLSSLNAEKIIQAIMQNQAGTLQSIKGIGTKTAQRIILDLKDKFSKPGFTEEIPDSLQNNLQREALSGLLVLGFNKAVAEKTINSIIAKYGQSLPVEQLIKEALRVL